MSARCLIACRTCSRYVPARYCSVWLIPSYSTPSSSSAWVMAALKCSAQFGYADPAGAGTDVSGLPMCACQESSTPSTPFGTLR